MFTIDGVQYEFKDGMTWEDWCNSNYNQKVCIVESSTYIQYVKTSTLAPDNPDATYVKRKDNGKLVLAYELLESIEYITNR